MKQYAFVENGQVIETHYNLPHCWRNISGLDLSKDNIEFLNSVGWYVISSPSSLEYNSETHDVVDYNYIYTNGSVTAEPVLQEKPAAEVLTDEYYANSIRIMRDEALNKSDWTQCIDVIEAHSPEWNLAWKQYRQKLRDLPSIYNQIRDFQAFTHEWPPIPTISE